MRTLRAATLVATVVTLVLAGCGGDNGGGAAEDAETLQAGTEAASGEVEWCIGKDTSGAFQEMVDLYGQENPDVTVRLVELPTSADQQRTQQIQRLRAESPECDILGMDVIWTAEYAAQGWIRDLSSVIEERQGDFIESTVETANFEGKHWAVPFNTNAGFLFYRSDQVQEAPETWQDVYDQGQQGNGVVYQGARYEGLTVNFLELLYSAGGSVVSEDGQSVEVDSQEARDVLAFMADGIENGAAPKAVTTYMEEESRRAFEAGNATFMRNWPYAYALGNESNIEGKFEVVPFPSYGGGDAAGVLGGYNLAVSAYSENPEAAIEFINFVTTAEPQKVMAAKASLPPVLAETYDDPEVQEAMPFAEQLRQAVEQGQPRPVSPVYPQISEAIYTNVHDALTGKTNPDEAVSAMAQDIQSALETF